MDKKRFFLIFLFLLIINLSLPNLNLFHAFSEEKEVLGLGQVCLLAIRCDKTNECPNIKGSRVHQVILKTDPRFKPPANRKLYLVEAVSVNNQNIYHTGIKTDRFPSGEEEFSLKAPDQRYKFLGFFNLQGENITNDNPNPTTTNDLGDINPIIWFDESKDSLTRMFLGFFEVESKKDNNIQTRGALQQGTISFDWESAEKDCVKIAWDPYGKVFDAQTLEPVPGVTVSLLKKTSSGEFVLANESDAIAGQIINPQTTSNKAGYGSFNFIVVDGTYKLMVSGANIVFPISNLEEIHSNYRKIYKDIYPLETGVEIVQRGKIEHRDIPVKITPITNNPVILIESFYEKNNISGTVSHPFTKINFYTKVFDTNIPKRYRLLGTKEADKDGRFSFKFDQSKFDLEKKEFFGEVELVKQDLTTLAKKEQDFFAKILLSIQKVFNLNNVIAQGLQTTTINFNPILPYIEGYAYDQNGDVLPNAIVKVMLNDSVVYYQTRADKNGYFKILSDFLPKQEYYLKYLRSDNKSIKITTANFLKQNQKYLTDNKINLNDYKSINEERIKPTIDLNKISPSVIKNKKTENNFFNNYSSIKETQEKKENTSSFNKTNNQLLIIIMILLVLIFSVIGISIYYFINKKQS